MPDLRYGGFFHIDVNRTDHPIDLLEDALGKSGYTALFAQALLVLPEAFNIRGDYYSAVDPDKEIERQLKTLSSRLGLCFLVGLIEGDQQSTAVLIDGPVREILSRKTRCDGAKCYTPSAQLKDQSILHRGLRIGALVCMDAADGEAVDVRIAQEMRHAALIRECRLQTETVVVCVPGRFGTLGPVAVAKAWNEKKVSIIIANKGSFQNPSVLHLETGQICIAPADAGCHVFLAALPIQTSPESGTMSPLQTL